MAKPTNQMFFDNDEDSAKRKPLTALEIQRQKQAKLNTGTTKSIAKLGDSIGRAHYVVGALVLKNPDLFALVQPHIESRLHKEGSDYKVVQEYAANVAQVAGFKKLLRR